MLPTVVDDKLLKNNIKLEKIERAKKNKVLKVLFLAKIEKKEKIFEGGIKGFFENSKHEFLTNSKDS